MPLHHPRSICPLCLPDLCSLEKTNLASGGNGRMYTTDREREMLYDL